MPWGWRDAVSMGLLGVPNPGDIGQGGIAVDPDIDKKRAAESDAPEGFDAAGLWDEQQQNKQDMLAGLQKQSDVAQSALGELDTAQTGARNALRRRAAAALASGMGRAAGGGGGLAGVNQLALDRGVAEGNQSGEFAMQRAAAQKLAAQAQSDLAGKKQELTKDEMGRANVADAELSRAQSIVQSALDNARMFWTDNDRQMAAARIRRDIAAMQSDPVVKKKIEEFADQVAAGTDSLSQQTHLIGS